MTEGTHIVSVAPFYGIPVGTPGMVCAVYGDACDVEFPMPGGWTQLITCWMREVRERVGNGGAGNE